MNKAQKIVVYGIISMIFCYLIYFVFNAVRYGYRIDMKDYKSFMWFFKDSIKNDIDTNLFASNSRKRDKLAFYNYKHKYYISIWEFINLKDVELNKISINRYPNFSDIKFDSYEILNEKGNPNYIVKFGPFFKKSINVNVDNFAKLDQIYETSNYKVYYGTVNQLSLSDENGNHHVIIRYDRSETPFELLFYKGNKGLYLITINSEKPFEENLFKIFNFN